MFTGAWACPFTLGSWKSWNDGVRYLIKESSLDRKQNRTRDVIGASGRGPLTPHLKATAVPIERQQIVSQLTAWEGGLI